MQSPVLASQVDTVLSDDAVHKLLVYGTQVTSFTESTCPLQVLGTAAAANGQCKYNYYSIHQTHPEKLYLRTIMHFAAETSHRRAV